MVRQCSSLTLILKASAGVTECNFPLVYFYILKQAVFEGADRTVWTWTTAGISRGKARRTLASVRLLDIAARTGEHEVGTHQLAEALKHAHVSTQSAHYFVRRRFSLELYM
jgi:hypothetical protein